MKIVIVGAGSVGRATAIDLLKSGNQVTMLDKDPKTIKVSQVPDAEWVLGDAGSLSVLEELGTRECDALIAATGDDKVNLVVSLLAKTVFGVPKVVARANHISNEWMFNSNWGIDAVASAPSSLSAVVAAAVSVGQAVQVSAVDQLATAVYTIEIPTHSPLLDKYPDEVVWPAGLVVAAQVRDGNPMPIQKGEALRAGDDLLFVTSRGQDAAVRELESLVQG